MLLDKQHTVEWEISAMMHCRQKTLPALPLPTYHQAGTLETPVLESGHETKIVCLSVSIDDKL